MTPPRAPLFFPSSVLNRPTCGQGVWVWKPARCGDTSADSSGRGFSWPGTRRLELLVCIFSRFSVVCFLSFSLPCLSFFVICIIVLTRTSMLKHVCLRAYLYYRIDLHMDGVYKYAGLLANLVYCAPSRQFFELTASLSTCLRREADRQTDIQTNR